MGDDHEARFGGVPADRGGDGIAELIECAYDFPLAGTSSP
jgi:hypothetical protein